MSGLAIVTALEATCRRCAQVLAEPRPTVEPLAQHGTVAEQVTEALVDDRPIPLPVAQHEIGHILGAWCCVSEKLIAVIARPSSGSTWHESPLEGSQDPAALRDRVLRAIPGILAGAEVDRLNGLDWPCSRGDVLLADRLLATVGHVGGHDAALRPLRHLAREIVRDGWPLIEPLALVLQEQRQLPGPAIAKFLEGSPEARELRWFYSRAFATPATT